MAAINSTLNKVELKTTNNLIHFSPRSINLEIGIPTNPLKEIQDFPIFNKIIENPLNSSINEIMEITNKTDLDLPTNIVKEIEAARLIGIRRRKMKKHKLKKLRKRMKFEWAKVRQRREMRKEKAFQAKLIAQIKLAEKFSAEEYVAKKILQATETPLPRYWKGKRLPVFLIKEKLGIK